MIRRALIAASLLAAPAVAADYRPPDYRNPANWLCRPGADDPCSGEASATRVAADGKVGLDLLPAAKKPKIDCFYVYPTVSTDAGANSDMMADEAERVVAQAQAAPLRQACQVFAPLYRQVTLANLRARAAGTGETADWPMAFNDVEAAFADYLKHDNKGRGFILIGHSQGSRMLKSLVRKQIEGKPIARQMVSVWLAGTNLLVPAGKDVGGEFAATPLCRSGSQTGCALAWVSFRDTMTVPPNSLYGRPPAGSPTGMEVACTNPAALVGGSATLQPLMVNRTGIVANGNPPPKWAKGRNIYTPFVALPGLLTGECMARDNAHVLSIGINADPSDPRTDTINGDVVVNGQVIESWGLHLIDMNVVMEDLVALAKSQGDAWLRNGGLRRRGK
jgi:hypothetical protein